MSARVALKVRRCDGWGCADRSIPLGTVYARKVTFPDGGGWRVVVLCRRCAQRYALCKAAVDQREAGTLSG